VPGYGPLDDPLEDLFLEHPHQVLPRLLQQPDRPSPLPFLASTLDSLC
jgi:hypothetical protein